MRLHPRAYSYLALLLIVLASCGDKTNVPVPADASVVLHIDGGSLHSKFGWDEFKNGQLYKIIATEKKLDTLQKEILENPEASGIDIKADAFLFLRNRGNNSYTGATFALKDRDAFEKMVKKLTRDEIETQGSLSVMKNGYSVMTWSNNRAVWIAGNSPFTAMYGKDRLTEDSLIKFAQEVYDIKGKNSAGSDKRFADMMKEKGDMHLWVNAETLYGGPLAENVPLKNITEIVKGNVNALTINFENGRIAADAKSYYNEKMAAVYSKLNSKKINEDMLKKIPSDNVVAVFALSYPSEAMKELLAVLGVDALANMFLTEMGSSLDEILRSLKGDIMVAITDVGMSTPPPGMSQEDLMFYRPKPDAGVLVATSLNDRASFDKLLALVRQKTEESGASFDEISRKFPHKVQDGWFIGSNDSTLVNSFGLTNKNHHFISKISGHSAAFYLDIQKLLNGLRKPSSSGPTGGFEAITIDESVKTWQDMVFYAGQIKDRVWESHFEINLVDKNTNSLKQIHDYIARIVQAQENWRKEREALWNNDSMRSLPDSISLEGAPKVEEVK